MAWLVPPTVSTITAISKTPTSSRSQGPSGPYTTSKRCPSSCAPRSTGRPTTPTVTGPTSRSCAPPTKYPTQSPCHKRLLPHYSVPRYSDQTLAP
ncbi:MAG: hypothetical protein [Circular genetic element sp.]|nr:MAG: hypothetical protein [Circular genetic element sp.]